MPGRRDMDLSERDFNHKEAKGRIEQCRAAGRRTWASGISSIRGQKAASSDAGLPGDGPERAGFRA